MKNHIIAGVHIVDRVKHAATVQRILTEYGTDIRTRLGLHDNINTSNGLILLELEDGPSTAALIQHLGAIDGVECQKMVFRH